MKTLKFIPELAKKILSGEKTSTWRLFDDKDLQVGDQVIFTNKETDEQFGTALITGVTIRTLGTLADADWDGHERYASEEDMYEEFRKYYGPHVGPDTEVKILTFNLK